METFENVQSDLLARVRGLGLSHDLQGPCKNVVVLSAPEDFLVLAGDLVKQGLCVEPLTVHGARCGVSRQAVFHWIWRDNTRCGISCPDLGLTFVVDRRNRKD